MRVLAIPGSLRSESLNARLLRHVAEQAPRDIEIELWEDLRSLPHYDQDLDVEPAPEAVADLRDAIDRADAILIATPEYNHSIPGVLKNAIDWASRPRATTTLRNKPAAVIGASTGRFGAVWAQADLRKVLAAAGARVIESDLAVPMAEEAFDEKGRLTTTDHAIALIHILEALEAEVRTDAELVAA